MLDVIVKSPINTTLYAVHHVAVIVALAVQVLLKTIVFTVLETTVEL